MSAPVVGTRGLGIELGGRSVLDAVDLAIQPYESLAVVGPNGAGKTTLLRLLAGVVTPSRGKVEWNGSSYAELSRAELARRVAYVPQVRPVSVPLSVEQVVLLGRHPHLPRFGLGWRPEDYQAARQALETAGLTGLEARPMTELSGGERQSVYIAAALAQEAELLILDEPTTHLDPAHQRQVATLVAALSRQQRTVVTATHDLNFAALVADRILGLRDGRVVVSGPPREVLQPSVLARLFGAPFDIIEGGGEARVLLRIEDTGELR